MRAVDTNVLVRLATRDDDQQTAAAEAFVAAGAWVPHLVLAEAMGVLGSVYDLDPAKLSTAVEMFLNHRDLTLQDADAITAALEHFRQRPALGFSDCLILEVARKAGPGSAGALAGLFPREKAGSCRHALKPRARIWSRSRPSPSMASDRSRLLAYR